MVKASASKSDILSLEFDFKTKAGCKRAVKAYSAEITAGMLREGITLEEVAKRSGCSMFTVWKHRAGKVQYPQVRTMFGILFALGWSTITVHNARYSHTASKAA